MANSVVVISSRKHAHDGTLDQHCPNVVVPVSRDIVSPHKTIRGMYKSIAPDGIDRYRVSP